MFKLASSNIKAWEPNPDDLEQTIEDYIDHIKEGRSEQDILYELLLKRGLDLCAPIETREFAGKQVDAVDQGTLIACLAEEIVRRKLRSWLAASPTGATNCAIPTRPRWFFAIVPSLTTWQRLTAPRFCGSVASGMCGASDEISV